MDITTRMDQEQIVDGDSVGSERQRALINQDLARPRSFDLPALPSLEAFIRELEDQPDRGSRPSFQCAS